MPLKINGTTVPYSFVTSAVIGIVWLAGLSFQVNANNDQISTHVPADTAAKTEIKERLAKIETRLDGQKEDTDEIKDEQKSQSDKLDRILEKLD